MTADRRRHMTRLSRLVDGMVAPSVQKRGFVISRVVSQWRFIAGDMADWSRPAQLNLSRKGGGTLKVAIASGFGPIALQMKPSIIDRVNVAFGYRAVEDVTFVQTLPPQRESLPRKNAIPNAEERAADIWELDAKLERIRSSELRAALRQLGRARTRR
ncbi:MAG: DciA family protein [Pseudomonadota bacterium]|nr:DciA family protein [Pseudomonadota bacterium]